MVISIPKGGMDDRFLPDVQTAGSRPGALVPAPPVQVEAPQGMGPGPGMGPRAVIAPAPPPPGPPTGYEALLLSPLNAPGRHLLPLVCPPGRCSSDGWGDWGMGILSPVLSLAVYGVGGYMLYRLLKGGR